MSLAYIGSINLGILSPMSLGVSAALTASLQADLQILLDLVLNIGIVPPTILLSIDVIIGLFANINLALTISPPLIYIDLQIGIMLDLILELSLELALCIPFEILLDLKAEAGIFAYGYNGTGADFGAAASSALATWPDGTPSSATSNALILATVQPSVWADIEAFFDIIPPSLPPGLNYIASVNLGLACGLAVKSTGALIADLKARLKGALALTVQLNITLPTIAVSLAAVITLLAALEAALEIGLPGIAFQLEAIAAATLALEAKLALLLKFTLAMSGGGAYVYTYSGPGAGLGPALTGELASGWPGGALPGLPANALVLGTTSGITWSAMTAFFGGI